MQNRLTRAEKLHALQRGYAEWLEKYPAETDDEPGNHLQELQNAALEKALQDKGSQ